MTSNIQGELIPIKDLLNYAINGFLESNEFQLNKLHKVSLIKKLYNERKIKKLTERLINDLEPYKAEFEKGQDIDVFLNSQMKDEVKSIVSDFMLEMDRRKHLFDKAFLKFFIDKGYLDVAEEFIAIARKEDSQLNNEEIFQAMRNVWIMNSLQIYWGLPLEMTPSVYAYSMLYPYTDNFLDNPDHSDEEKLEFNKRFYRYISGEKLRPANFNEEKAFSLINKVESQYSRGTYPQVFESLMLIQEAQTRSMAQANDEVLTDDMILPISFFKGGTSVLADAFLVKGNMSEDEMHFAFAYGTFLQLLDDLQDAKEDKADGNQTLFSTKIDNELIDKGVKKLVSYIFKVNSASESDTQIMSFMKDVISSCTLIMVMDAVGRNPDLISDGLYKELESYSKVRLKYYKRLEDRFKEWYS